MELMARKQCKKTPNWKASGRDDVQGFWIKKLDTMRGRIARQLNYILNGTARLPKWTTYGRSVLCEKDPTNGSAADNYRPISYLPLMWKMTGIIAENMYSYLERENIANCSPCLNFLNGFDFHL